MSKLRISPDLALPIEAVTEALGFLGRRGSGKSYAAQKLAEQFHRAGAQFVAVDPVGNWWALRLAANGRDAGLPIPVFGGLQGDIPLEPTAGKVIADTIVDRGISAVIDVSQFESDADKARFARAFCERFYFRKKSSPSAVHVFLEEAQEFVPQNPTRDEPQMLHAFTRLAKLGRNFGIGISLISQRPQEVNKKVLNLAELLFVFQLTGVHERKRVEEWIGDKGIEGEDIEAELPKLERGHPHAWSPAWLKVSKVVLIAAKETLDASSTPKVGATAVVRELSPIDLEKLRTDMAATIERAKADDPKELRREIAVLKKQIASAPASKPAQAPVVDERAIARAVAVAIKPHTEKDARLQRLAVRTTSALRAFVDAIEPLVVAIGEPVAPNGNGHHAPGPKLQAPPVPVRAPRKVDASASPTTLTGARLKIVRALAELDAIGIIEARRQQLSFYAGLTFTGGYGSNTLGALRTEGLLDYPRDGYVALTAAGQAAAGEIDPPTSLRDLHARIRSHLSGLEERIFDFVIDLGRGGSVTREYLGEQIGATFSGGYGSNTLGALRTAGLIDYPDKGNVGPSDLLFPEGLE